MSTTVWAYVDTSKQVGDPDHLKLFCQSGGGRRVFFAGNDPEEFAFE